VTGPKRVVFRLISPTKWGETVFFPDGMELIVSTGEDLVDIGLVTRIPNDLVPGRIKYVVEGDGQLGDPQTSAEMASDLGDHIDVPLPGLLGQLMELLAGKTLDVPGGFYPFEDSHVLTLL